MTVQLRISVGEQYEKWTVIEVPHRSDASGKQLVVCQCVCGFTRDMPAKDWKARASTGCVKCRKPSRLRHGHMRIGHESPTHRVWRGMRDRCENPRSPSWPYYGAKGIAVCERWRIFEYFLADMGERPSGYTIDRHDSLKGYTADNCHWLLRALQNRNKTTNRPLTLHGVTQPLIVWAEQLGRPEGTIRSRKRYGWSDEEALLTPVKTR